MSDHTDAKMRELTYRLVAMAPEAPPFPEESMVQLKPAPTREPRAARRNPLAWAGAAALAVILLIAAPLLLVELTNDGTPSGPATTLPGPDATTPAFPDATPSPVIVAATGGGASSVAGVIVVDADVAVGDGDDGLVLMRSGSVLRVAADGSETTLLDPATVAAEVGPASVQLEDVTTVDGRATAIVVVRHDEGSPDTTEEIWLVDLDTGSTESVYRMVATESHITRVSAAAGTMIASISFEGGTSFEYLTTAGQPIDPPGPYAGSAVGGPEFPALASQAVLSPGGLVFAFVEVPDTQATDDDVLPVNLVLWDLDLGREIDRLSLELTDGAWPGRMDYDGVSAVLGRDVLADASQLPPLHIPSIETGAIVELDIAGTPSLLHP